MLTVVVISHSSARFHERASRSLSAVASRLEISASFMLGSVPARASSGVLGGRGTSLTRGRIETRRSGSAMNIPALVSSRTGTLDHDYYHVNERKVD